MRMVNGRVANAVMVRVWCGKSRVEGGCAVLVKV